LGYREGCGLKASLVTTKATPRSAAAHVKSRIKYLLLNESLINLKIQYIRGYIEMGKRLFRNSTQWGKKKKWRVVRNPWWVKQPYRLEPCSN